MSSKTPISIDNLKLALSGAKVAMKPNWNQNDPNGLGYIQNRPFYEETKFVTQSREELHAIILDALDGKLTSFNHIIEGLTFRVVVNGKIYDNVPVYNGCYVAGGTTWGIGDLYEGGPSPWVTTDYGFCLSNYGYMINSEMFPDGVDTDSIEVQIPVNTIKKIDPKFLPSNSLVVKFSYDEDNDRFTADKTFEEVVNAFRDSQYIYALDPDGCNILRLCAVDEYSLLFASEGSVYQDANLFQIVIIMLPDGTVELFEDWAGRFEPATADSDGRPGFVPAPMAGDQDKFLKGDGTWADIPKASKSYFTLIDHTTGEEYVVYMNNGSLVSELKSEASIELDPD